MDTILKQIAGKIYQDMGVMYFFWDKHRSSCDAPPFLQESQNKQWTNTSVHLKLQCPGKENATFIAPKSALNTLNYKSFRVLVHK